MEEEYADSLQLAKECKEKQINDWKRHFNEELIKANIIIWSFFNENLLIQNKYMIQMASEINIFFDRH